MNIPEPIIQRVVPNVLLLGALKRTWLYFTTPNQFKIKEDWKITLPNGQAVLIRKGFVFDGASIPWFLRPFATSFGPLLRGGLVHDYGYRNNHLLDWDGKKIYEREGQKFFDDLFREIIIETSNLKILATWAWSGVRLFGFMAWNKRREEDV